MLVKESVDNKELLSHQQSVTTAKTTKEDQNPVYADAGRQMEKTAKIKADVVKVEEEPKRDEKPKAPKMTPGARKMYLDESLFESSDSNFDKVNLIVTKYLGNYLTDDELESATQSIMQSISKNSSDLVDSIRNGLLPYIRTEISFDDIKDIVPEIKGVLNIVTEAKNDIESKLYDELSRISAGVDKNGKPKHAEVYSNPQGNGYKIETELKNVIDEASKIAEKYKLPYRTRPFRNYYLFTVDLPEKLTEARIGKTKEVKVLQGNYGYGWDDLVTYDIEQFDNDYLKMMAEIRQDRKDYDNNEQGVAHRVITRRVPRETLKENKINLKK